MPVYLLNSTLTFPPVDGAEDGIVAIGGDLSSERLLLAYQQGIFPWYSKGEPIIWHSPEDRFILLLDELHISKSMRRVLNSSKFRLTFDIDFSNIIQHCAAVERKDGTDTWITDEMIEAYTKLYDLGYAHSVEVWSNDKIVGGLYGVSLGKCFFAESMFHAQTNASKFALIKLVELLKQKDFHFIDAQVHTDHVATLGAKEIPRNEFIKLLQESLKYENSPGKWTND